jgi:NAD(P)-dependent dehydrogenase (short-subunit alcohol dehydrogenase family)
VIHGAGIVEDRLVGDKSLDSFRRVVATKVAGALALARALRPDDLRFFVLFTSIAGRFGNRGQADYAAASAILSALATTLNRRWPGRVVAIDWGPWAGTGMASPELCALFEERGIRPIDPSAGVRALERELARGRPGDAEVVIGDGPWALAADEDRAEMLAEAPA